MASLTVPSGIAAILIAMIPLWFALFGWLYLRESCRASSCWRSSSASQARRCLSLRRATGRTALTLVGIVILLLAPIGWAHGSIYSARKPKLPPSPLTASASRCWPARA